MNAKFFFRCLTASTMLGINTVACEALDNNPHATPVLQYAPIVEHRTKLPFEFKISKEQMDLLNKSNVEDQFILGTNTRCMLGKLVVNLSFVMYIFINEINRRLVSACHCTGLRIWTIDQSDCSI